MPERITRHVTSLRYVSICRCSAETHHSAFHYASLRFNKPLLSGNASLGISLRFATFQYAVALLERLARHFTSLRYIFICRCSARTHRSAFHFAADLQMIIRPTYILHKSVGKKNLIFIWKSFFDRFTSN